MFECKSKHTIFTGKNALKHAVFYSKTGRMCDNPDILFNLGRLKAIRACSWHRGVKSFITDDFIDGEGVHMKCYELGGHIIYSSQNDCDSPLFEFAILYEKKPRLLEFFIESFERAKEHSAWWKRNNYYGLKGKKNE